MLPAKDKILYTSVIILLLLFCLSFVKSCRNTDKREIIKTALVNQKYENQISEIVITKGESKITLEKKEKYWLVMENESELSLPADSKKINSLLKELTSLRNLYKLSDKISKNNAFGFNNSDTCIISYTYPEGIHELYFGNQDFAQTSRYLMTDKNTQIYEIDSAVDRFLSTNSTSWTEPFLISQEILGPIKSEDIQSTNISDVEKFLDLRHGGFPDFSFIIPNELDTLLNFELGNKCSIKMEIYSTNQEAQFLVKTEYTDIYGKKYYCCSKISSWTYNKIKEITL